MDNVDVKKKHLFNKLTSRRERSEVFVKGRGVMDQMVYMCSYSRLESSVSRIWRKKWRLNCWEMFSFSPARGRGGE